MNVFKNSKYLLVVILVIVAIVSFSISNCSNNSDKEIEKVDKENVINDIHEVQDSHVANYEEINVKDSNNPFYLIGRVFSVIKVKLLASLLVLLFLWIVLSLIFYLFERHAQPKVYHNFGVSFLWTFVKSISDPGEMAPNPPVTLPGKIVANIIGFLGIIVIAIPTGLFASGFDVVMDEESEKEEIISNIERVKKAFRWPQKADLFMPLPFVSVENLLTRKGISEEEVYKAVIHSPELHLYNLSRAYNVEDAVADRIVVVACPQNRPYGYCIDRGSKVTIVSTSGYDEPITSWVAFHIAKIGGFNYVAKELEKNVDEPISYYKFDDEDIDDNLRLFLIDINKMSSTSNSWVIPMASCTGPKSRDYKFHFAYSYKKGIENYCGSDISLKDTVLCEHLFVDMNSTMIEKFNTPCDKNKYYDVPKNSIAKRLNCKNVLFFRPEAHVIYFSAEKEEMIKTIADVFNRNLEPGIAKPIPPEMINKPKGAYGYSYYIEPYKSNDKK